MSGGGRVLVVDDEESMREGCRKLLSLEGFEVDTARDGKEALGKIEGNVYDVVITDWKMPQMGGIDLLRKLLEKDPRTRLIMISGFATLETAVEAMRIGAADYLAKPFTDEQLCGAVKKAIWVRAEAEAARKGTTEEPSDMAKAEFDAILREYDDVPGAVVDVVRRTRAIFGFLPAWTLQSIATVTQKPHEQIVNLAKYLAFTFVEGRPRTIGSDEASWRDEDSYLERILFSD